MHELSLARSILRQVGELSHEFDEQRITTVELEVGLMSGVDADMLATTLYDEQIAADSPLEFVINVVPVKARCVKCQREFQIDHFAFMCVTCGSVDVDVLCGDSVRIMSVTVEELDA